MTMASPGRSELDMLKVLGVLKKGIFGKWKYHQKPDPSKTQVQRAENPTPVGFSEQGPEKLGLSSCKLSFCSTQSIYICTFLSGIFFISFLQFNVIFPTCEHGFL